jgi:hypothetical protein
MSIGHNLFVGCEELFDRAVSSSRNLAGKGFNGGSKARISLSHQLP